MSARVSFADLLKAGANKEKQRLNLKLAVPTPPTLRSVAPEKDFTKVANSIAREAVPDGLFIGKSKQIYDYLYSVTRGALQPKRAVRITKTLLMQNADIGSDRTLLKNLRHLKSLGLIKIIEFEGQREGNQYETFLPEEIQSEILTSPTPPHPPNPPQKVVWVPPAESGVGGVGQIIENKTTYSYPKTSFKDFKENDDEPAARGASPVAREDAFREGILENLLDEISKKTTGKCLKISDNEILEELTELLKIEFETAVARANSISNVPAFLTEHLRRRLSKKPNARFSDENSTAEVAAKSSQIDESVGAARNNELYQAEPLTEQARETVLKTMREYVEKGHEEFLSNLRDTYTATDWQWLSENLPNEIPEK